MTVTVSSLIHAETKGKKLTLAVIPKGTTHSFWKSIHAGALMAAGELGDVEIVWKGGLTEDDRDAQIKVVEDMITRQVNGIVLRHRTRPDCWHRWPRN